MDDHDVLAERFEAHRGHLRGVAYRMLGSRSEADDAVQEAWLRLSRADTSSVENLGGWLTTVVARVCLDMMRARASRREEPWDAERPDSAVGRSGGGGGDGPGGDAEQEAILAESVGLALLVVLETLGPAERLAFVLHDMFAVPFEEIAAIVGRTPAAARQLASRARRRVQGAARVPEAELKRQRRVVDAFLAALKGGDFEGLLAVLDPDVVVRADAGVGASGREVRGARVWAKQALAFARAARFAVAAMVDGEVGVVMAPGGRLFRVLRVSVVDGKIGEIEVVAETERLGRLELGVLEN